MEGGREAGIVIGPTVSVQLLASVTTNEYCPAAALIKSIELLFPGVHWYCNPFPEAVIPTIPPSC